VVTGDGHGPADHAGRQADQRFTDTDSDVRSRRGLRCGARCAHDRSI